MVNRVGEDADPVQMVFNRVLRDPALFSVPTSRLPDRFFLPGGNALPSHALSALLFR